MAKTAKLFISAPEIFSQVQAKIPPSSSVKVKGSKLFSLGLPFQNFSLFPASPAKLKFP